MCTVLLPPGDNPIAVNKYIIYHIAFPPAQWLHKRASLLRYIYIACLVAVTLVVHSKRQTAPQVRCKHVSIS